MKSFYIEHNQNNENYFVAVKIIIYKSLLGGYPSFLDEYNKDCPRYEYKTTFSYLLEDNLSREDAIRMRDKLEKEFSKILHHCERTGEWDKSPYDFSKLKLIWSK